MKATLASVIEEIGSDVVTLTVGDFFIAPSMDERTAVKVTVKP